MKNARDQTNGVVLSELVISFTTIEFPNESVMQKAQDAFKVEKSLFAEKLRQMGMIRFHSSRLFMQYEKLLVGNWLEYRDMEACETFNTLW